MAEPSYGDYTYPEGAIIVGWIIAFISLIPIPALAVHELCKRKGSFLEVCFNVIVVVLITPITAPQ